MKRHNQNLFPEAKQKLDELYRRDLFEHIKRRQVADVIKSYIINNTPYLPSLITPQAYEFANDVFNDRFVVHTTRHFVR